MAAAMEQDMAKYQKVHSETYQQAEINTIDEILLGTAMIGKAYNDTIAQAQPGRNAAAWQLQKYQLEVGAVFSAGQILGYFQSAGMTPGPVNLNQPLQLPCGVGGRQGAQVDSYPGLAVLGLARELPHGKWAASFSSLPPTQGIVADLDTMMDQIADYGCTSMVFPSATTPEGVQAANYAVQGLNDAATCGYQLGLLQGETAMEVGVLTTACGGGRRKKKRGGRRKIMRGGALDENTQLNLLTTALILGGIGGGYALGAGAAIVSGFDFCYRQGRSILYALNWLKRPCISDASIISGLIFKSIPGLGSAAKSCLEVAQWNKVMNTALIGIVGTVYSTAIALGLKTISGGNLISGPGQLFSAVKENVSRPLLRKLKSVGEYAYSGAIVSFRLVQDGVGSGGAAVQAAAAHIVALLQRSPDPSSCPTPPATEAEAFATDQATVAAAVVATNDATAAITNGGDAVSRDGQRIADISPEQETALQAVLDNMSPADKAAFIEAVRLAVRVSKENRAQLQAMSAAGEKAFAETQGDEAAKQAAAATAFMTAFVAQDDPQAKKGIFALMDDEQKELVRQNAGQFQIDMSTLEGGRRRSRRKTRRHRNKKKKAKTMRKKKTRGRRKPKRKTKGKKSKARRKTRNYRR